MEVRVRRFRGLKAAGFPESLSVAEKRPARRRRPPVISLLFLLLTTLIVACQTPPRKSTTARNARSSTSGGDVSRGDTLDLFALSAERFGTDPRVSRPLLVSDTVWIVVAGSVALVSGAALLSAVKSGRAGRSSRRRT
jgi:hypothetical protein